MADSFNEDDDLRRLKDWWKQNGTALVLGVGAGVVAIAGWQWWQARVENQAYSGATAYQAFSESLESGAAQADTVEMLETIRDEFGTTPYPARASLDLANHYVEQRQLDKAASLLAWVAANANAEPLRLLARGRQARVLWAQGEDEAALKLLSTDVPPAYTSLFREIEGDIQLSAGRLDQARQAYAVALDALPEGADAAPLRTKLESAGGRVPTAPNNNQEVS
jgi:predicted negative regulator of RcsB-dependent stress response